MSGRPIVTLYTNTRLIAGPPFNDMSGLASATTRSVTIMNGSPYTFIFSVSPGGNTLIQPGYQATIPILPNTPWRLSYVDGSPTQATDQIVTIEESEQDVTSNTSQYTQPLTSWSPIGNRPFHFNTQTAQTLPLFPISGLIGYTFSGIAYPLTSGLTITQIGVVLLDYYLNGSEIMEYTLSNLTSIADTVIFPKPVQLYAAAGPRVRYDSYMTLQLIVTNVVNTAIVDCHVNLWVLP